MDALSILMIVPNFLPESVVGAVRVSYWARYFVSLGHKVAVAVPGKAPPTAIGGRSPSAVRSCERDGIRVVNLERWSSAPADGVRSGAVRRALKHAASGIGHWRVPDRRVGYWRKALPAIKQLAVETNPQVLITSSPPHSIHLVGLELTEIRDVLWIADRRDPYLSDSRYRPKGILGACRRGGHVRYDRAIYDRADHVVHAVKGDYLFARSNYPALSQKMSHIPNGFPESILRADVPPGSAKERRKRVVSAGVIGARELTTVERAIRRLRSAGHDVELRVCGPSIAKASEGVAEPADGVVYVGSIAHDEAIAEIQRATILLAALSIERSKVGGCSSKLYEYMATGKPILAINPTCEDERLLERHYDYATLLKAPTEDDVAHALLSILSKKIDSDRPRLKSFRQEFARGVGAEALMGIIHASL